MLFCGSNRVGRPGNHVATLIGGQVFREKPSRPKFQRLIQQFRHWGLGKELPRLEKAFFHTPVLSKRQLDGALRILVVMAAQLGDFANRNALRPQSSEPDAVSRAKQFVNASIPQTAKLDEVSRHVGLSRNHFCRVFKHGTGITFTEYLARLRVEKAKELLADVRVRITEAADRAGFNSISQFNRVFRRYAGSSPTEYRRRLPALAKLA